MCNLDNRVRLNYAQKVLFEECVVQGRKVGTYRRVRGEFCLQGVFAPHGILKEAGERTIFVFP